MTDELKRQYADKLHWLEMGVPYPESETNPNPFVFTLAMEWGDLAPLLQRIAELEADRLCRCADEVRCDYLHRIARLERLLVDVHDMLDYALHAGYHTDEGALRINWCHLTTKKIKEQHDCSDRRV
jgi:hypothetical protein